MKKERVIYLDLLRIISIFAVVILHVAAQNWYSVEITSFEWKTFNIYDSLVRFAVPVFVMISGALLLNPEKELSIKKLWSHNILRIITTYIFWSFIYVAVLNKIIGEPVEINAHTIADGYYHMWFMPMIISLYIMTPMLRKIAEDKKVTEYFLIFAFLFNSVIRIPAVANFSWLYSKFNFNMVLGYSGYFLAGYYLQSNVINRRNEIISYILGILGFILTAIMTYNVSIKAGMPIEIYYDNFAIGVVLEAVAIFIFGKNLLSKIQFSDRAKSIIQNISLSSFGIYLVHVFIIEVLKHFGLTTLSFNPIASVLVISLGVFAVSYAISAVIHFIPVLKKYIV